MAGVMVKRRFFGQVISVERGGGETRTPTAFSFGGERHAVARILASWQDFGFPDDGRRHTWRQRRHRTYYRVETDGGRRFEIYYDRGVSLNSPKHMRWYVSEEF